jgi:hypothetical protein
LRSRLSRRCRANGRDRRRSRLSASRAARRLLRRILTRTHDFWCEIVKRVGEAPGTIFWRFPSRARPCDEVNGFETRTNAWPAATASERGKKVCLGGRELNALSSEGIFKLFTASVLITVKVVEKLRFLACDRAKQRVASQHATANGRDGKMIFGGKEWLELRFEGILKALKTLCDC